MKWNIREREAFHWEGWNGRNKYQIDCNDDSDDGGDDDERLQDDRKKINVKRKEKCACVTGSFSKRNLSHILSFAPLSQCNELFIW